MTSHIINDAEGKGFVLAFEGGDVEYVNPISYYKDRFIGQDIALFKALLRSQNPILESYLTDEFYINKAMPKWERLKEKIEATKVPDELLSVLVAASKKEQEKALKGAAFNYLEFAAFLFTASNKYDFTFSNYLNEQLPKNINVDEMPEFVKVNEDGSVTTFGGTKYSVGQLKTAVQFRRVVVAKFLDRGDEWHCFFVVYRSLKGEESWRNGQPHFHYLSNKWGLTREEAIAMFKGDRYPSTSVHIIYNE